MNALSPDVGFVRRYVDDIIVCTFRDGLSESIQNVIRPAATELRFTVEKPEENAMQFLDLRIDVGNGLCWEYGKQMATSTLNTQLSLKDYKSRSGQVPYSESKCIRMVVHPLHEPVVEKAMGEGWRGSKRHSWNDNLLYKWRTSKASGV